MEKWLKKAAVAAMVVLLSAGLCSNTADAAKKVKISKTKLTLKVGQSKTLSVKNLSKKKKKKVKWSSSKKRVATVSKKGKVTAKKAGTAKITAKVGKKKYTCKVTVKKKKGNKPDNNTNEDNTGNNNTGNNNTGNNNTGNNNTGNNNTGNNNNQQGTKKVYKYGKLETTAGFAHVISNYWCENKKAPVKYSRRLNNDWFEIDLSDWSQSCKGFSFVIYTGCGTGKNYVDKNFNPIGYDSKTGISTYNPFIILQENMYTSVELTGEKSVISSTIRSDSRIGEPSICVNKLKSSEPDETGAFTIYFDIDYTHVWQGLNPEYESHIEGFMAIPNYVEPTEQYCSVCVGTGRCQICNGKGEMTGTHTTCQGCKGSGKCKQCGGDGKKGIKE